MRTAHDFRKSAKENNITRWPIHNCSMCSYPCGYEISGDDVWYDSGCDCVTYHGGHESSFEDIASHYNMQSNEKVIEEMDAFWKFSQPIDRG